MANLTPGQIERRAYAMATESGLGAALNEFLTAPTGRPRSYRPENMLVMFMMAVIAGNPGRSTAVRSYIASLPHSQQRRLGYRKHDGTVLSYDTFRRFLNDLGDLLSCAPVITDHNHPRPPDPETGELPDCPPGCSYARLGLSEFTQRLIAASVLAPDLVTGSAAIDGTDVETCAVRRWRHALDIDDDHLPINEKDIEGRRGASRSDEAATGSDGRHVPTLDPDAREGHRSSSENERSFYVGWECHIVTNAARKPGQRVVPYILGLGLAPAGSHVGNGSLPVVKSVAAAFPAVDELLADRAYNWVRPESFTRPVRSMGIDLVLDLHPRQKRRYENWYPSARATSPAPIFQVDGIFVTNAIPESLIDLPQIPRGQSDAALVPLTDSYERRLPYMFRVRQRFADGRVQYEGPARTGHLRRPNNPESMRRSAAHRPTSTCSAATPCSCSTIITLRLEDTPMERIIQTKAYGTADWNKSRNRRNIVENTNNLLKEHYGRIRRGFSRVFGTARNQILVTFAAIAHNIRLHRNSLVTMNLQCRFGDDPAIYAEQQHQWANAASPPLPPPDDPIAE